MSKPRARRRSTGSPQVINLGDVPTPYTSAAIDLEPMIADALGLPSDPYEWTDPEAQIVTREVARLAYELWLLVEVRRQSVECTKVQDTPTSVEL